MNYCINNKEMDLYIPDATYLETIERFFWLKVNYNRHLFENLLLNNIQLIYNIDHKYYIKLKEMEKEANEIYNSKESFYNKNIKTTEDKIEMINKYLGRKGE